MNGSDVTLMRSLRGPVMLVAFGTLLAVDHGGSWSFWRTWPVLPIVYGVMKLVERAGERRPESVSPLQGSDLP